MKKSKVYEERIKNEIRDIVVINPMISTLQLQKTLFERGFKSSGGKELKWTYVAKLVNKITKENIAKVDRQKITERLAITKERYRMVFERLMKIAFYSKEFEKMGMAPPSYRDQIAALNSIIKMDLAILNAEMDAGIFERHIGTLEVEKRSKPLPKDAQAQIIQAMENWGIIKEVKENGKELKKAKSETKPIKTTQ